MHKKGAPDAILRRLFAMVELLYTNRDSIVWSAKGHLSGQVTLPGSLEDNTGLSSG
jgi:hypothetical protein